MNICFYGRCFEPYVSSSLPKGMRKFYKKYGLEPMTPYRFTPLTTNGVFKTKY